MSAFLGAVRITNRPILGCRSGDSTVGCLHLPEDDEEEIRMSGRRLGAAAEYVCPVTEPSYDPTLNCMRDARGNAVCSDGSHYPPGCPHTPPDQYFTPGVTPDVTTGGRIEGQLPAPRAAGSAGSAPGASSSLSTILPVAGVGAAILAVVGYFTFK